MRRGSAGHRYLEVGVVKGAAAARVALDAYLAAHPVEDPSSIRRTCDALDLAAVTTGLEVVAVEPAYTYDIEAGTAREVGRGIEREYLRHGWVPEHEIAGSADLVLRRPGGRLVVLDHKFSSVHNFDGDNLPAWEAQLDVLALMIARAYGTDEIEVGIHAVPDNGANRWTTRGLDALDLDAIACQLRESLREWREAHAAHAAGRAPKAVLGDHCRWCPKKEHCPAQHTLARSYAAGGLGVAADAVPALSPAAAGALWVRAREAQELLDAVVSQLKDMARRTPLTLPTGERLGLVEHERRTLDGAAVLEVLTTLHGAEVAAAAVERSSSQVAMERVLGDLATRTGVPRAELMRRALAEVEARGGIKTSKYARLEKLRS